MEVHMHYNLAKFDFAEKAGERLYHVYQSAKTKQARVYHLGDWYLEFSKTIRVRARDNPYLVRAYSTLWLLLCKECGNDKKAMAIVQGIQQDLMEAVRRIEIQRREGQ
jgi:hypothetical protein